MSRGHATPVEGPEGRRFSIESKPHSDSGTIQLLPPTLERSLVHCGKPLFRNAIHYPYFLRKWYGNPTFTAEPGRFCFLLRVPIQVELGRKGVVDQLWAGLVDLKRAEGSAFVDARRFARCGRGVRQPAA